MKRFLVLAATVLLSVFAPVAYAAETVIPEGVFLQKQGGDQQLARDFLIGAKVYNADNKIIGDVEDLILDELNRVEGVIIGVGGVLGLGEKRIGVRYAALTIEVRDGKQVVVLPEASQDVLKALKPYERARPPATFFERAMDKAKELAAKTSTTAADAFEKAKEKVGPAYEAAKKQAGQAYEAAKEKVKETVDQSQKPAKTE